MQITFITKAGKIPKNKWIVYTGDGTKYVAQVRYKSSAIDRALTENRRTGRSMVIGELAADHLGHVSIFDALIVNKDGIRRV